MLNLFNTRQNKQNLKPTYKYILIRQTLDKVFNAEQFQQIQINKPSLYLRIQCRILGNLLRNEEIFGKYFEMFYENHVKLYDWYLLSREKHHEIQPYIFKKLLKKTLQNYKDQMKAMQEKMAKEKQREKQLRNKIKINQEENQNGKKKKLDQLSKDIFHFMSTKTATASLQVSQKPWSKSKTKRYIRENNTDSSTSEAQNLNWRGNKKLYNQTSQGFGNRRNQRQYSVKKVQSSLSNNHDFHDLYIQTFHACDGQRYIFYDYQKHMKGLSEKDKYNMFIRKHHTKGKNIRHTQPPQEQSTILKGIKNYSGNIIRSAFQFSPYGSVMGENIKKKSKIVFRRVKSNHNGKFIRK